MTRKTVAILGLLAALALAGCGKMGDLERPGPLWGPDARARAQTSGNTAPAPLPPAAP
jgi:hypothetical protein